MNSLLGKTDPVYFEKLTSLLKRRAHWIAAGLILLGTELRLYRLANKAVWWDEGASVYPARLPLLALLDATAHDVHPPAYLLLLKFWRLGAGDSEFALRLLSVLAGVLLLPVAYRFVRSLAGVPAALVTTCLLCLSRILIWYSQEIRFYSLTPLLGLVSVMLAVRIWRGGGWREVLGYAAVNVAGLLTLYLFVGVPVAENAAFFLTLGWLPDRRHRWRTTLGKWVTAQVIIGLSLIPWLWYFLPRMPPRFSMALPLDAWATTQLYLNTIFVGNPNDIHRFWPVVVIGLALLTGGLGIALREAALHEPARLQGVVALIMGVGVSLGLVWLLNLPWRFQLTFTPTPRYFVTQAPWAIILLGIALAAIARRWPSIGYTCIALILAGLATFTLDYYGNRYLVDDYKSAAATLRAFRQPDDALILHNDRDWPIVAYHIGNDLIGINSGRQIDSDEAAAQFAEAAWTTHAGVWLFLTPEALVNDPEHRVYDWLASRAIARREFRYGPTAQLFFFARTAARAAEIDQLTPAETPPLTRHFSPAPGLTLVHATWELPEYRIGDTLHLFLFWRNEQAAGLYAYKIQLVSRSGSLMDEFPAALEVTPQSPPLIRQQLDIPLHAYLHSGSTALTLVAGSTWTSLGRLPIVPARAHPPVLSQPAHPMSVRFENGITLRGYTVVSAARGEVAIDLYWTTVTPVDDAYKTFVHLQGPLVNPATGNGTWAQEDRSPNFGRTPTTTWRVGETILDTFLLTLPPGAPAGDYAAEVGWYDFITGQRLLTLNEAGERVDSRAVVGPFYVNPTGLPVAANESSMGLPGTSRSLGWRSSNILPALRLPWSPAI